jgi:hypothetical protein
MGSISSSKCLALLKLAQPPVMRTLRQENLQMLAALKRSRKALPNKMPARFAF